MRFNYPMKEPVSFTLGEKFLQEKIIFNFIIMIELGNKYKKIAKGDIELTSKYQNKLEFIKNPVIAEFLGMQENISYYESDLEQCIINNLQRFMMELGKGFAFVERQQRIHTEKEDYYIDLVFYNSILKCYS